MDFDIAGVVNAVGESFTVSGVTKIYNPRGDDTEAFTAYTVSGVVQVMDGSEEEVTEGILEKEDIIAYVDEDTGNANQLKRENYITVITTTSGIFRIANVIHNAGHYEVHANRVMPL